MAFTLQIKQKKLFGKTVLDIPSLARACGLCYGSNNEFYILQENEQKNDTKEIGAFYALTEECENIFPVRADGFLNLGELKVTEGFVQFVLYSEQRVLEGMFPYEQFIEELKGYDVQKFDADHILIPSMTKAELEKLDGKLRGKGRDV